MGRFLTPSKVALLCLISLYTEGVVPNTSAVPILSFIISHILPITFPKDGEPAPYSRDKDHAVAIEQFEEILSIYTSSIPGRSLWDLFLKKIWSLDSCDALEVFFSNISTVLVKTREEQIQDRDNGVEPESNGMLISRTSPLGLYIRRAQLEFVHLHFHDSVKLWRGFIKYRLPTHRSWLRRNASEHQTAIDVNLEELGLDTNSYLARVVYGNIEQDLDNEVGISTKDVERLLEFQVGELQRFGGRVSDEMKEQLEHIIASGVTVPSTSHYLRFLDSWKAGDYPSSFDNLHRYYDYTMHMQDRSFYQYALVNLAILQADFGCYSEAISAMQEALSIARESHDMQCLNFCMSWLYHFGKAFPEEMGDVQNTGMLGSEKEGLAFLKVKARESEMWSLLSTTLLSEARLELQNGESLASVFESVAKASHLNTSKNMLSSIGPQFLLQIALYSRIGLSHIAQLNCEIFRECYASEGLFEDYLKGTFRSCQLLYHRGSYKSALSRMTDIAPDKLRPIKASQYWAFFCGMLKLQRAIHQNERPSAEHLLAHLQSIKPPHDADLSLQLATLHIDLLIRKGDYATALEHVERLSTVSTISNDIAAQTLILTLKARILGLIQSGQKPQRGFSLALRAASLAYKARCLPALWDAIAALCNVLIHGLREYTAAVELLEAIMPQVLETEDRALAARCFSLLVDANMGIVGGLTATMMTTTTTTTTSIATSTSTSTSSKGPSMTSSSEERDAYLALAVEYIDLAYNEYSALGDLSGQMEMLTKRAVVMRLSGDDVLANDYAARVVELRGQVVRNRNGL